jgi:hypothetical protein
MAYVKRKRINGVDYYYLVESYRAQGKVKSRTLAYLGKDRKVPAQFVHLAGRPRRRRRQQLLLPASRPVAPARAGRQRRKYDPEAAAAAIWRAVLRGPRRI